MSKPLGSLTRCAVVGAMVIRSFVEEQHPLLFPIEVRGTEDSLESTNAQFHCVPTSSHWYQQLSFKMPQKDYAVSSGLQPLRPAARGFMSIHAGLHARCNSTRRHGARRHGANGSLQCNTRCATKSLSPGHRISDQGPGTHAATGCCAGSRKLRGTYMQLKNNWHCTSGTHQVMPSRTPLA